MQERLTDMSAIWSKAEPEDAYMVSFTWKSFSTLEAARKCAQQRTVVAKQIQDRQGNVIEAWMGDYLVPRDNPAGAMHYERDYPLVYDTGASCIDDED